MKHYLLVVSLFLLWQAESFSQCSSNAGPDQTVCSNVSSVSLNGVIGGGATGATWLTSGTGTFSPSATTLNAVYHPSAADITSGFVVLGLMTTGCSAYDSLFLNITHAPSANAGADQSICSSSNASLNGSVAGATGGVWTTSGTGSFANQNSLTTSYIPSAADKAAGNVTITLTTTGNGVCAASSDAMIISMVSTPTANAGADQSSCGASVSLNGTTTGSLGAVWSTTGSGTFSNPNSLTATYTLSAADQTAGTVTLTLTTTGNGACTAASDQMNVTFVPAPNTNAGTDQFICSSNNASLNGSVTGATGGTWTTSGSGSFANQTSLTTAYTPSAADKTAGSVDLILTSTGNGACNAVSDTMRITIASAPTDNAGPDQISCGGTVSLSGTKTGSTGATWSTTGTGIFANPNSLSTSYTASASDQIAGTVTLTLTTTGNGACSAASDQMDVAFVSAPVVNAGADQAVCGNVVVNVSGTITNATGGHWTTSGHGTFGNANTLTTTYTPAVIDSGNVTLTLTSTGNGSCTAASDQLVVTKNVGPLVDAGPNLPLVAGGVQLNGNVMNAAGGIWSTSGSGSFSPANTSLTATYTPSAADMTAGSVTVTLTSTGNGICSASSAQALLTTNSNICNLYISAGVSGNTVYFYAVNDDSTSVGAYYWNFGDGIQATGKVQTHTYGGTGGYTVSVNYVTADGSCQATKSQVVTIASIPVPTYSLSGTIRAGANTLDSGMVTLFKLNNSSYDLVARQPIAAVSNGTFTFTNLEDGDYLMHAYIDPASAYASNYISAYYGDSSIVSYASQIHISGADLSSKDIHLFPYTCSDPSWHTGNDTINGVITFDASVVFRTNATTPSANPVENALVILYNSNGVMLTSVYTDEFGNYEFSGIKAGNYLIKVEYAGGVTEAVSIPVSVDGNPATISTVDTELLKQSVTTGVAAKTNTNVSLRMYPNPASSDLTVEFPADGNYTVRIYSAAGRLEYSDYVSASAARAASVDIQNLAPGLYILEMLSEKGSYKAKFSKN